MLAADDLEIVIGKLAPLLFGLSLQLRPLSFNLDPNSSAASYEGLDCPY